jgi:hypothetical protein
MEGTSDVSVDRMPATSDTTVVTMLPTSAVPTDAPAVTVALIGRPDSPTEASTPMVEERSADAEMSIDTEGVTVGTAAERL